MNLRVKVQLSFSEYSENIIKKAIIFYVFFQRFRPSHHFIRSISLFNFINFYIKYGISFWKLNEHGDFHFLYFLKLKTVEYIFGKR